MLDKDEFIKKLHKQAAAVYLACDEKVAKDISESLSHAAMLLTIESRLPEGHDSDAPIFPSEVLQALLDWSGYEPSTSVLAEAVDKWTPELEEFMQWQIRRLASGSPQEPAAK